MNKTYQQNSSHLSLPQREVFRVSDRWPRTRIVCETGLLWVTSAGDPEDHLLKPGDSFIANKGGKVVIEAIRDSQVRLVSADNAN